MIAILYFTGVLGARAPSLLGTWSPACTDGRAQALIFTGDNRVITSGGTLAWSQSGDTVTLSSPTGGGPRVVLRWERLAEGRARVTEVASGQSNILNRCG